MRLWVVITALMLALPAQAGSDREPRYTTSGLHLSGDARMGVVYDDGAGSNNRSRLQMTSRTRLHFQLVGETDGGMRFGVSFDVDKPTRRLHGQQVFFGN